MFSRLQAVAVVAAVTWTAYGLYWLLLVPIVEPPAPAPGNNRVTQEEVDKARQEQIARNRERFLDLFRPGDWELESPKVIESENFLLLLRDYRPLEGGRIELQPCTLLIFPSGRPPDGEPFTGRAIVLQAPEGAILQFDDQLDLRRGKLGQLVGGKLAGQVKIHARESRPGAGDELEIVTRNVQMNAERIWTPHELTFRYGQSHGSGRDLQILLSTVRDPSAAETDRPALPGGLRSIELVHVDKVFLQTGGHPLKAVASTSGTANPLAGAARLPVEITCRGPFLFDLERRVASFDDQVDVVRLHPSGPSDQLSCRTLELFLGEVAAPPVAGPGQAGGNDTPAPQLTAAAKPQRILPALTVERVRAIGAPVVLRSPAFFAEVRGDVVEYDLRTNTIRLDSETKVSLKQAEHDIQAVRLEYTLADDGGIGRLWAQGPGNFQRRALVPGQPEFTARWQQQLLLRPHDNMHVLSLTREATLELSGAGQLSAGEIHLWLKPHAVPAGQVALPGAAPRPGLLPDRLLAKEKVHFASPKLVATTSQLEVWIKDRGGNPIATVAAEQPLPGVPAFGGSGAASPQQFTLNAGLLRLLVMRTGALTQLEDVTAEGDVRLIESVTPAAGEQPIVVSGQRLQLLQASSLAATLGVFGQPAELHGRGFSLLGDRIRAHRGQARLWIDGPGRMVVPTSLPGQTALLPGSAAPQPAVPASGGGSREAVTVDWRGALEFNGRTLRCQGGVAIRGSGQHASCEILTAALERPLDLTRLEPPRDVQVRQISLQRQVAIENRSADPQGLISVDRLQLHDLTVDHQSGDLHGTGPGWLTSVRRGGPTGLPGGTAAAPTEGRDRLNYLRIDFQQGLAGNLQRRELRFVQQVKGVFGPVGEWNATLEPQSALASGEAALLACDQLLVRQVQMPGAVRSTAELEATGSTIVEGRQFTARCQRLSYTEAKDLLVIEGDGRADAELVRREVAGGPDSRAAAGKILFWRTANRVEVDDARFLDLTQFAQPRNAQQPPPPTPPRPPMR